MSSIPEYVPISNYRQLIGGKAVSSASVLPVVNPATGSPFADCPSATRSELDEAVVAARAAYKQWSKTETSLRRKMLHDLADVMEADIEVLAGILTAEQGKPLARSRDEITRAAYQMRKLSTIELTGTKHQDSTGLPFEMWYRPLGVIGAIAPWNMPLILGVWKIVHALYTGNTIVLKPSPYTPLATLRLGEIANRIFPPGVLNILAGGDDLGRWMTEHPDIDKISFTGSVRTGKLVMASAAGTLKRVTLELGGNDAAIVLKDVNPQKIAQRLFGGAFTNSGQICMAIKRLYVEAPIFDEVCEELATLATSARVGNGFDPEVTMGPVQNAMQYKLVQEVLSETERDPAAEILGGRLELPSEGYFIAPRIVANPSNDTRLVQEETFGPLLPVMSFDDVESVIQEANATRYGLSGSVWSERLDYASGLAKQLEVGTAWVNHHLGSDPLVPLGGVKESGIGREMSLLGLQSYMESQVLSVRAVA